MTGFDVESLIESAAEFGYTREQVLAWNRADLIRFGDELAARVEVEQAGLAVLQDSLIRCVLCPASTGAALAAGWTWRTLTQPVTYRSALGHDLPPTPAGYYALCAPCSAWLADAGRQEKPLPPAVTAAIDVKVTDADLHPMTARRVRAEMVGMVRHLADHLQPA